MATAGSGRWRFLGRRALQGLPTILLIVTFNFFLLHLAPGDPASVMAGEAGAATPEYMAQLRAQFGLDQPLIVQYLRYAWNILTLDFGYSFRYQESNLSLILGRMSATLLLAGSSIVISVGLGTLLGLIAAMRRGTVEAALILLVTVLAYASPIFWLGLMFVVVFAIQLGWVPTSGMTTAGGPAGGIAYALDVAHHLVLPAVTLSLFYMALYTRLMRASVLENLRMNYVTTARAKGVPPRRLVFRHVLRNAALPVVTMAGVQVGGALGGAVIVESVFGWPGLGQLAFEALFARDLNLLLGILTLSSVVVVIANLLVDLVHSLIDPRVALA